MTGKKELFGRVMWPVRKIQEEKRSVDDFLWLKVERKEKKVLDRVGHGQNIGVIFSFLFVAATVGIYSQPITRNRMEISVKWEREIEGEIKYKEETIWQARKIIKKLPPCFTPTFPPSLLTLLFSFSPALTS